MGPPHGYLATMVMAIAHQQNTHKNKMPDVRLTCRIYKHLKSMSNRVCAWGETFERGFERGTCDIGNQTEP
jgi:hypothetical protein